MWHSEWHHNPRLKLSIDHRLKIQIQEVILGCCGERQRRWCVYILVKDMHFFSLFRFYSIYIWHDEPTLGDSWNDTSVFKMLFFLFLVTWWEHRQQNPVSVLSRQLAPALLPNTSAQHMSSITQHTVCLHQHGALFHSL